MESAFKTLNPWEKKAIVTSFKIITKKISTKNQHKFGTKKRDFEHKKSLPKPYPRQRFFVPQTFFFICAQIHTNLRTKSDWNLHKIRLRRAQSQTKTSTTENHKPD